MNRDQLRLLVDRAERSGREQDFSPGQPATGVHHHVSHDPALVVEIEFLYFANLPVPRGEREVLNVTEWSQHGGLLWFIEVSRATRATVVESSSRTALPVRS